MIKLAEKIGLEESVITQLKVIYEKKILLNTGRVSEGSVFTGLLTDDATALGYIGNIAYVDSNYSNEIKIDSVKINEDLFFRDHSIHKFLVDEKHKNSK